MKPPVWNPEWPDLVKALYTHDLQEVWDRSLMPHVYTMVQDELQRYRRLAGSAPRRILDVGCAQGTLALLLAEDGHDVTAMDLRQEFLDYAQTRYEFGKIEFVQGNVLALELDTRYDMIFANQLLEHLVYPQNMIDGLVALLRPGGRLVVTTPNGYYLKSRLPLYRELGDPDQFAHRQFFPDGDGHFFAYAPEELTAFFSSAGLREVTVMAYASPWITGHMRFRHLHRWFPRSLLRGLDRITLTLPGIRRRWGYQLMASGRKEG